MMFAIDDLRARLLNSGQIHLLNFWDDLCYEDKNDFLVHINSISLESVNELFQKAMDSMSDTIQKLDSRMKPVPPTQFESEEGSSMEKLEEYRQRGLEEIRKGHVGIVLMAGGQGTRLGVSYPKGMYCVGLPSGKTLFQIQAERIRRVQQVAEKYGDGNSRITWYIMTSGPTRDATEAYLKSNNYFGLKPEDVLLFEQGLLPCFDMDGKILLEEIHCVALAPDGNGGIYRALYQSGILSDMENRGILHVHVHSVDNILVKVADPVFIGYCVEKEADCGAKVVRKSSPSEAVGVVCQVDGRFQVVEYSEITESTASLRNPDGTLVFNAGNICNHFFSTEFLRLIAKQYETELKLHVAKKKIPHVNSYGIKVIPEKPNGIKIEKFVFDVFQFSNKFVTWEVPRDSEFSALKNADSAGKDCPSTARNDLSVLHKRYVEAAGGTVVGNVVEISPLLSYSGEDLASRVQGKIFHSPVLLLADSEMVLNGHKH